MGCLFAYCEVTSERELRRALKAAHIDLTIHVVERHIPHPPSPPPLPSSSRTTCPAGETGAPGVEAVPAVSETDGEGALGTPDGTVVAEVGLGLEGVPDGPGAEHGEVAPGQLLTHYAPDVPAVLLSAARHTEDLALLQALPAEWAQALSRCVVIDFGKTHADWSGRALAYQDLSAMGDTRQAQRTLFAVLRWAEAVPNADQVLLPDIAAHVSEDDEHLAALTDRLFRACSGRTASLSQILSALAS
mmetsp:Transcript_21794/g.29629  ORF Transcript_21794/g.29629 Transcript_21794/m.29629 type:complete len:246 (+) Transcript_21794:875-1612(+)